MGDSETVVAQTSAVMGYTSTDYTSTGYADASLNITHDVAALPSEATGEISTSAAPADVSHSALGGSSLGDGNTYTVDSNTVMQESHVGTVNEIKTAVAAIDSSGNVAALENEAINSSQAGGYGSSVNGVAGVGTVMSVDNGDASDSVGGAVHEQQYVDGSGIYLSSIFLILS